MDCGCGRRLFVLPLSPLPRVGAAQTQPVAPVIAPRARGASPWRWPLVAAGLTLGLVISIFVVALPYFLPPSRDNRAAAVGAPAEELGRHTATAEKALGNGDFAEATQHLGAALELARQNPSLLSAGRLREIRQQRRQAVLLAKWPGESVEVVLSRAAEAGLADEDWQNLANRRCGQTVVFDGMLRRDVTGLLHVTRREPVKGLAFSFNLRPLKLLACLPLNEPQRVILLARLANIRREGARVCTLDLDSAALLTDQRMARRCGYAEGDREVAQVLERQARWVAELPVEP